MLPCQFLTFCKMQTVKQAGNGGVSDAHVLLDLCMAICHKLGHGTALVLQELKTPFETLLLHMVAPLYLVALQQDFICKRTSTCTTIISKLCCTPAMLT